MYINYYHLPISKKQLPLNYLISQQCCDSENETRVNDSLVIVKTTF